MMTLADFSSRADEVIENRRRRLRSDVNADAAMSGRQLVLAHRAAATAALFVDYDPDAFQSHMVQAGAARVYVLDRVSPAADSMERFLKATEPGFVDALACQSWAAARQIGGADFPWRPRHEYEEDYLFHQFLADLVVRRDDAMASSRLEGIIHVRDGARWARLGVGQAILARDADAFDDAFRRLLDKWEDEVAFWETSMGRDDITFMTDEHVFIEGLAVLQVARALGVEIREAYRFCPAETLALAPPSSPQPLASE